MAKRDLPKRMFKDRDVASSYKHERSPVKLMKQMSRDHLDVLQNIEFTLLGRHRRDPSLDDRVMSEALRAAVSNIAPHDPRIADVHEALAAVRQTREDVSDDVWRDALRVVDESVRTHSRLRPGETSYLSFIAHYVR
jgi:hypothetical protein